MKRILSPPAGVYVGRLAPTPSGLLHIGHARTFYTAYRRCLANSGVLILRIEDLGLYQSLTYFLNYSLVIICLRVHLFNLLNYIDYQRCKFGFLDNIIEDLQWLGLNCNAGYAENENQTNPNNEIRMSKLLQDIMYLKGWNDIIHIPESFQNVLKCYRQSGRLEIYQIVWTILLQRGYIYPSAHTRREIERFIAPATTDNESGIEITRFIVINSLTHSSTHSRISLGIEINDNNVDPVFPTALRPTYMQNNELYGCNSNAHFPPYVAALTEAAATVDNVTVNWRFRVPDGKKIEFIDQNTGYHCYESGKDFGDFVIWTKENYPSYELAVVVDDALMGVTEIVRGEDLLISTARQLLIYEALDLHPPAFYHCPLVFDPVTGRKFSKREKSQSLKFLRENGSTPTDVIPDKKYNKKAKLHLVPGANTLEDLYKNHTKCNYFLEKKRRLCTLDRNPSSQFCGVHLFAGIGKAVGNGDQDSTEIVDERVPCPLDPSHCVYKKRLQSHLQVCNVVRNENEIAKEPFYSKNLNSGNNQIDENELELTVDPDELLHKVNRCFDDLVDRGCVLPDIVDVDRWSISDQAAVEYQGLEDIIIPAIGGNKQSHRQLRHIKQDAHIIQRMMTHGLFDTSSDDRSVYVELGAGKGELAYAVSSVKTNSKIVMVERAGNRKKVDRSLRRAHNTNFHRVRMDIRHVYLPTCPGIRSDDVCHPCGDPSKLVIIAKHLCGLATDLAIRSILPFQNDSDGKRVSERVQGVAIATCCHHALSYQDYTGIDLLRYYNISSKEFDVLKTWSGWINASRAAAGGNRSNIEGKADEEEENEHTFTEGKHQSTRPSSITTEEMVVVGRKIKRIFDAGRVQYLQSLGFNALQIQYCDSSLSPECVMIIANRKK